MTWQLQEAKNRFSEVVRKAVESGPQTITVHGRETAVVLSAEAYRTLTARTGSLADFLRASPLVGVDLDLERSRDTGREVAL